MMITEGQPGNTNVQYTHVESRKLQAEFLRGNMIDNVQISVPSFPQESIDECDSNGYAASFLFCDYPLSVWWC